MCARCCVYPLPAAGSAQYTNQLHTSGCNCIYHVQQINLLANSSSIFRPNRCVFLKQKVCFHWKTKMKIDTPDGFLSWLLRHSVIANWFFCSMRLTYLNHSKEPYQTEDSCFFSSALFCCCCYSMTMNRSCVLSPSSIIFSLPMPLDLNPSSRNAPDYFSYTTECTVVRY